MSKPKILIQFDPDSHASTFDSVVAIDAGVDQLLCQSGVTTEEIEPLVHGAMFTRGPANLKNTALFFGGSNVAQAELLVDAAKQCFFGPMRVSLLSDPNGCNTTAAAAVLGVEKHLQLAGQTITVLAGTGPVGQRIAQLVAGPATSGAAPPTVRVCSRRLEKAEAICGKLESKTSGTLVPLQTSTAQESLDAISGSQVVFAAGAAGIELLPAGWAELAPAVAVDLNAVPPAGIFGIEVMDGGQDRNGVLCFGAIGVGGLKMKIHKRAIQMLFESNDQVLQVEEIYQLGKLVAD